IIQSLENEIEDLKSRFLKKSSNSVVPDKKALVVQKSSLEVVIVKK
ncbi:MAG TPA: MerR family transcriptional regulator, partial [Arcobacter skirrowii]|nr:MerR family transcriptional regulator [Aliarcobacter skirrowii]